MEDKFITPLEYRYAYCARCHTLILCSEGWPHDENAWLCQECWETECNRAWWRLVQIIHGGPCV